jgi:hypothetical protein
MGFIFIAIGVGLWIWIHKRRFDRTNSYGVQEFQNFWHFLGSNGFELVVVLFGLFLILIGLVLFFVN